MDIFIASFIDFGIEFFNLDKTSLTSSSFVFLLVNKQQTFMNLITLTIIGVSGLHHLEMMI